MNRLRHVRGGVCGNMLRGNVERTSIYVFSTHGPPPPQDTWHLPAAPRCLPPGGMGEAAAPLGMGAARTCAAYAGSWGGGGSWEAGRPCGRARRARRHLWGHVASWGSVGKPMAEDQRARPAGPRQSPAAGKSKHSPESLYHPILESLQTWGVRGLGKAAPPQRTE